MRSERTNDREWLEQEIRGEAYTSLLQHLQQTHAFLRRFSTWADVVAFMREGTSSDPRKDGVLLPILQAHARDGDARWRTILLVIFWPGIESVCKRKGHWEQDEDLLWGNAVWAFLQAVCKLNISRRTDRLVPRIINGTIHRLHDEYSRQWRHGEREVATDPEELDEREGDGEAEIICTVDLHLWQDAEVARFRGHMEAGRISEADFHLLVGTRVYSKSAAQYAREVGISGDVARKRRQRAEAVIREFEEKTAPDLSRSPAPEPPFPL